MKESLHHNQAFDINVHRAIRITFSLSLVYFKVIIVDYPFTKKYI